MWDVASYASGWRWAAMRSGSSVPEGWVDGGDVGVRGATLILRDGDELRLRVHPFARARWAVTDDEGHTVMRLRPQKDDRVAIEIAHPVVTLVLLLTCLFVVVQRLQVPETGGGAPLGP